MSKPGEQAASDLRRIVRQCVGRSLRASKTMPGDEEDLLRSGALDSMGWIEVLACIERVAGKANVSDPRELGESANIISLVRAIGNAPAVQGMSAGLPDLGDRASSSQVRVTGWGNALGSVQQEAGWLEREYGLAPGKLREGAGIESVARAGSGEDELSLATKASEIALGRVPADPADVDWLITSSETFQGFPSLGALLHSRLLLADTCGVLDVGGACVGLVNALVLARSLLVAGTAVRVLVVTADAHSRVFPPGSVPGEFGGLFGDGASAFVLESLDSTHPSSAYLVGHFRFGCAGAFAAALAVRPSPQGGVQLTFEGEALARAAVGQLESIIRDLESRSGLARDSASGFATHQPNPRLVELLARQIKVPLAKFPVVAKTCGNLGTSTCGVALSKLLDNHGQEPRNQRGPIFLAAVGPGMLWGGAILY
jgi:3-oxoacyl-[acyl-carrier-protein] synthase-3